MTEATHTPGPWMPHISGGVWSVRAKPDRRLKSRRDHIAIVVRLGGNRERQKIHAHLVAAVPDMLAALKEAKEQLTWATSGLENDELHAAIGLADAAIAKAEGRPMKTAKRKV